MEVGWRVFVVSVGCSEVGVVWVCGVVFVSVVGGWGGGFGVKLVLFFRIWVKFFMVFKGKVAFNMKVVVVE